MNALEALDLLAQASGLAKLTREEHLKISQAVSLLHDLISPKTEEKLSGSPVSDKPSSSKD